MNIDILNPIAIPEWNENLPDAEGISFFHTANWAKTLQESYGFIPRYFSVSRNGALAALVPIMEIRSFLSGCRGVSLPFTDFCEPMCSRGEDFRRLFDHLADYGRKSGWKYFELRGEKEELEGKPFYAHYFTHTINLSIGEKALAANLRDSTRRNIKKAEKEKISIEPCVSRESVDEFRRLNWKTRRQHGLPPQPDIFFEKMYEHVISKGFGKVFLARHEGRCIAGNVYFHFGDRVIYKYGASDADRQDLRANNLVMWEAIRSFGNEGFYELSFGRTEPENTGLRQFKNGWGAEEGTVRYYRYDLRRNLFMEKGNQGNGYGGIMSRLPLPVLKAMGKYLYRHVG